MLREPIVKGFAFGVLLLLLSAPVLAGCEMPAGGPGAAPTAEATIPAGDSPHTITANSMQRTYLLHVPPGSTAGTSAPLVFVFHGMGEDGAYISAVTGMSEISDANGFFVVYPDGTAPPGPRSWNAEGCCGYALESQVDELEFVHGILADLEGTVTIDPKRIYATGFSNGAMLSYFLACKMSEVFAAVAPVSGFLTVSPCMPQEPVSILHIHGSGDVSVPYGGGGTNPSTGQAFTSVDRGIAAWVRLDGCADLPVRQQAGMVTHTEYADCRNGAAVELYVLRGWSHLWPPVSVLPASQVIWDFFAAHPKP
jgi:polyhydroxybutyrate depolymerase